MRRAGGCSQVKEQSFCWLSLAFTGFQCLSAVFSLPFVAALLLADCSAVASLICLCIVWFTNNFVYYGLSDEAAESKGDAESGRCGAATVLCCVRSAVRR